MNICISFWMSKTGFRLDDLLHECILCFFISAIFSDFYMVHRVHEHVHSFCPGRGVVCIDGHFPGRFAWPVPWLVCGCCLFLVGFVPCWFREIWFQSHTNSSCWPTMSRTCPAMQEEIFLGFCCWLTPITPTVLCASTCSDGLYLYCACDGLLDFHMAAELV